jgi:hypothetical protein
MELTVLGFPHQFNKGKVEMSILSCRISECSDQHHLSMQSASQLHTTRDLKETALLEIYFNKYLPYDLPQ